MKKVIYIPFISLDAKPVTHTQKQRKGTTHIDKVAAMAGNEQAATTKKWSAKSLCPHQKVRDVKFMLISHTLFSFGVLPF